MSWIIWIITAIFYFYEYLLRISPGVMVHELMGSFRTNATTIGMMSAFYFYAYAPMQLPVGMLMDKYGARKLLTSATLTCGLGAAIFAITSHIWLANTGRFLIGIGAAFAFIGMIYVTSHWFPSQKRGLLIGLGNSIGMLGAVTGQGPLAATISTWGWRKSMIGISLFGLILGLLIYLLVRNEPPLMKMKKAHRKKTDQWHSWAYLIIVCKNPYTWINAFVALLFYITTNALGGLWGVPFLQIAYHVSKETAGFAISMIFIGWLAGGPLIGHFSDQIKRRKIVLIFSSALTCIFLMPVIYFTYLPIFVIYILLFFVGIFSSAQLLNFSLAVHINIKEAKATAVAFTNFMIAAFGSLIQPVIGYILDLSQHGQIKAETPIYTVKAYQIALSTLPLCLILAFFICFFIKEKKLLDQSITVKKNEQRF